MKRNVISGPRKDDSNSKESHTRTNLFFSLHLKKIYQGGRLM